MNSPFVELSPSAKLDIIDIIAYTDSTHGEQQTEIYIAAIYDKMDVLAAQPRMGHSRDDIPHDFLAFRAGRHFIVYRPARGGIYVARILHENMDFKGHSIQ